MLENRKNVRKILVILMAIIAILGVFINLWKWRSKKSEIDLIAVEEFGKVKGSTRIAALDLEERSNNTNVQATMGKGIKYIRYNK